MAITKCPDCGGKVSEKANACIHCGCPIRTQGKTPSPVLLVGRILFGLIASASLIFGFVSPSDPAMLAGYISLGVFLLTFVSRAF